MITALFHRHREKQMDMDAELWIQLDTLPSLRFTAFRGEGGQKRGSLPLKILFQYSVCI